MFSQEVVFGFKSKTYLAVTLIACTLKVNHCLFHWSRFFIYLEIPKEIMLDCIS